MHVVASGRDQHVGDTGIERLRHLRRGRLACNGRSADDARQHRIGSSSPYAPELNSMENVWAYLRANKLSAAVWNSYEEIVAACADVWNWLMADPERIQSIRTREWTTVSV